MPRGITADLGVTQGRQAVEQESLFGQRSRHSMAAVSPSMPMPTQIRLPNNLPTPAATDSGLPGMASSVLILRTMSPGPVGLEGIEMSPTGQTPVQIEEQRRVLSGDRRRVAPSRCQCGSELGLLLDQLTGSVEGSGLARQ